MIIRVVFWIDALILSGVQRLFWWLQKKFKSQGLNYQVARFCVFFYCAIGVSASAGPIPNNKESVLFIMLLLYVPIGLLFYAVSRLVEGLERIAAHDPSAASKYSDFLRAFKRGRVVIGLLSLGSVGIFIGGLSHPGGPPVILRVVDLVGTFCAPAFLYLVACHGHGQPDQNVPQEVSAPPPPPAA